MYREELPHIYELRDLLATPLPQTAYFKNLDQGLLASPQKLRQYRDLERDLAGLDPHAWEYLKSEVIPLLHLKHPIRGWQPLFDKLNQAKAYNYLKSEGYSEVRFIPPSTRAGCKTPDLEAINDHHRALCEVKTLNPSDIEARRRTAGGVIAIQPHLNDQFLQKLQSTLMYATSQLEAFDCGDARKFIYVIINFDDLLHEYADRYRGQIRRYMREHWKSDVEVIFEWKPPFAVAAN